MEVCVDHGLPVEAACGGQCACTTCHVILDVRIHHLNGQLNDVFCFRELKIWKGFLNPTYTKMILSTLLLAYAIRKYGMAASNQISNSVKCL